MRMRQRPEREGERARGEECERAIETAKKGSAALCTYTNIPCACACLGRRALNLCVHATGGVCATQGKQRDLPRHKVLQIVVVPA